MTFRALRPVPSSELQLFSRSAERSELLIESEARTAESRSDVTHAAQAGILMCARIINWFRNKIMERARTSNTRPFAISESHFTQYLKFQ